MPKPALVLGIGLGVTIGAPLIGAIAVVGADLLFDWHQRRARRG